MLRGRGLLTSTGDAGALAVVAFKAQTSNQNMIGGLFPNNIVQVNQWQTKVNKPPSEHLKLLSDTAVYLHYQDIKKNTALPGQIFSCFF